MVAIVPRNTGCAHNKTLRENCLSVWGSKYQGRLALPVHKSMISVQIFTFVSTQIINIYICEYTDYLQLYCNPKNWAAVGLFLVEIKIDVHGKPR